MEGWLNHIMLIIRILRGIWLTIITKLFNAHNLAVTKRNDVEKQYDEILFADRHPVKNSLNDFGCPHVVGFGLVVENDPVIHDIARHFLYIFRQNIIPSLHVGQRFR